MMRSTAALALAASLATTPLAAFDLSDMSEAERGAFREEIRAYLLENPDARPLTPKTGELTTGHAEPST